MTKRNEPAPAAIQGADFGTAERWQHHARQLVITDDAVVARNGEESVLDKLLVHRLIIATDHEAGLRLRHDYAAAKIEARVIASYNPARSLNRAHDGGYVRSDAEEAAYQRWRDALKATGTAEGRVLTAVCCQDLLPLPVQLGLLKRGLLALCRHYGIKTI